LVEPKQGEVKKGGGKKKRGGEREGWGKETNALLTDCPRWGKRKKGEKVKKKDRLGEGPFVLNVRGKKAKEGEKKKRTAVKIKSNLFPLLPPPHRGKKKKKGNLAKKGGQDSNYRSGK